MGTDERVAELLAEWERAGRKPAAEQLCAGFPELAEAVRARIADRQARPTTAPEQGEAPGPVAAPVSGAEGVPPLPHEVGPYRILALLGEGGMGSVYRAEQRSPIRRVVAVKVVKSGFDTKEVIARFQSERQALARMDHPNIARVLDAGATGDTGRPYFVMEYVPGLPLARFCDDNKLSIPERLELFCQVCDAISHAHTKAILHRDIKSSNVLAYTHDGVPTAKVIDFGIAKALAGDRLTDLTFVTDQGRPIGTYDSMSPEQADGSPDIDTRTDVYSLGVLLYELLAGAKPFDRQTLANAADHEIRRIIREVDPPRLDTRLDSLGEETATRVATMRQESLPHLTEALRGELGWIPLKAMRKERARRYESPRQLADDIHNYLERRPLIAGPESQAYRMRKWVSRYRYPVGGAIGTVLVLLVATVVSLYFAKTARDTARLEAAERRRADANAARADASAALAEARARELGERAVQLNRQFADMYRRNALSAFERGETGVGLLWLARAIEYEDKDPDPSRARTARIAFKLALARSPRLFNGAAAPLDPRPRWADHPRLGWETPQAAAHSRLSVYDSKSETVVHQWQVTDQPPLRFVRWNTDASRVATVSRSVVRREVPDGGGEPAYVVKSKSAVCLRDPATGRALTPLLRHDATAGGADQEIQDVEFSDDGKLLMTITQTECRLWYADDGRPIGTLPGESGRNSAVFSPDGKRVYTADVDGTVQVWDVATARPIGGPLLRPGRSGAWFPSPSADGKRLAIALDWGACVWDLEKRQLAAEFIASDLSAEAIELSADGNRLAVLAEGKLGVYDVASGKTVIGPVEVGEAFIDHRLTHDGWGILAWQSSTGAVSCLTPPVSLTAPMAHGDAVYNAFFSPDGRSVVTAGRSDRTARVWDAADGRPITPALRHDGNVRFVDFDPSGARVVTAGSDGCAKVWDARTGALLLTLPADAPCWRAIFSPDGRHVAVCCEDGGVKLFDAATGAPVSHGATRMAVPGRGNSLAFSPDGTRLAAAGEETRIWRVADGTLLASIPSGDRGGLTTPGLFFSADGTLLLGRDGVYDAFTGAPRVRAREDLGWDWSIQCALSSDGRVAALVVGDRSVRLINTGSGQVLSPAMPHDDGIRSIAFSNDGQLLVTACEDYHVRIFAVRDGRLLGDIVMPDSALRAVFSPDGTRVLVGCGDRTATVWDVGPDPRPAEDLRRHAIVLSGHRVDEFDSVFPASDTELAQAWQALLERYPGQFPKLDEPPATRPAAP